MESKAYYEGVRAAQAVANRNVAVDHSMQVDPYEQHSNESNDFQRGYMRALAVAEMEDHAVEPTQMSEEETREMFGSDANQPFDDEED